MIPFVVIVILCFVVLIEVLIMTRQEVTKLRDIVDQWSDEQQSEAEDKWSSHFKNMQL